MARDLKTIFMISSMALALSMIPPDLEVNKEWKLQFQKDGIRVYSSKIPGSQIDEVKGECILIATLRTVAAVMLDVESYPQWVANCAEALKFDCTDPYTCKLYFDLAMPWPVHDRDIVLQSSADIELSQGRIVGLVYALPDELVPLQKNRIRIKSMYGKWIFERISADRTMAKFITWADPAGLIPPLIVNIMSRDIPYRTLKGLRLIVKKDEYIAAGKSLKF